MKLRQLEARDCQFILPIVNEWWDGRDMTHLFPRFLFDHFTNTSFVVEIDGDIIGFLIGFFSQTHQDEAYIHAVGIAPKFRGKGIGKSLYQHFYISVEKKNVKKVRCITSALNKNSIAYHQKLGFTLVEGDKIINGLPVHKNYDGKGNDRVLFLKHL